MYRANGHQKLANARRGKFRRMAVMTLILYTGHLAWWGNTFLRFLFCGTRNCQPMILHLLSKHSTQWVIYSYPNVTHFKPSGLRYFVNTPPVKSYTLRSTTNKPWVQENITGHDLPVESLRGLIQPKQMYLEKVAMAGLFFLYWFQQ